MKESLDSKKHLSSLGNIIIKREKWIPDGDRITQEDRIKNSSKEIVYPFLIIPEKAHNKTIWDIFIGIVVIYTIFMSPLDIAFKF